MALSITGTLRAIRQGKTWCKMAAGYFNRRQRSTLYGVEEEIICQPLELDRAIGCTQEKQRQRLQLPPDQPVNPRVLKVAIIGAYNSGKSTLTNSLMGWKVSAASCKIHTTQKNVLAVHTEGDTQIIFRDTPGLIRGSKISEKKRNKLLKSVLEDPKKSLVQADLICVMIDASDSWDIEFLDENIYHLLWKNKHIPSVLILNKIDLLKRRDFLLHITRMLTMDTVGGNKIPITTSKTKPGWKVVTFWSMQNDVLTIHVNINMFRSRSMSIVIGPKGSLIQKIKEESHAALMDAFRCDVILSLRVYKEEKKKGSKNKEYLDMKAFEKDKKSAQNTSKKPEVFTANNT
ncbi:GTPase Era, mitochondrial-like [Ylistrum balloti]|uniref:GTPase Era, mitochondrial-like n=1 Tax=Ylistrum balloti TaxID=509963 RepID=UPI002905B5E0|nr:GTPase Era, mitochondrial-like [Ylistrum balloti]